MLSEVWTVREALPWDHPRWAAFLEHQEQATFYHQLGWGDVISRTYDIEPLRLVCERDGQLEAIVQLFRFTIPLVGTVIASDLYTSYGGIVTRSLQGAIRLMNSISELAIDFRVLNVELKNQESWCSPGWQAQTGYCTMRLAIGDGASQVWQRWDKKARKSVRTAQQSGVTIEFGAHLLDEFYDLVARDKHRLGTPVHSKRLFENIVYTYPDQTILYVARQKGKAIAAQLTTGFGDTLDLHMGGMLFEYRKFKPTNLGIWQLVQLAEEMGYKTIDLGRSTWNSGTFEFKRHIGAHPVPLHYQYFLGKSKELPRIHQDNPIFSRAIKAWQCLPHPITRWLGPQLIRYIP